MNRPQPSNGEAPSEERRKAQKHGDEHMNNDTQEYSKNRSLWLKTAPEDREYTVEHSEPSPGRYVVRFATPFRIATVTIDHRGAMLGGRVTSTVEIHALGYEERYEGERSVNLLHHPEIRFDDRDDAITFARMWVQSSWAIREDYPVVFA